MATKKELKEGHWVRTPCGMKHGSRPCCFRMSTYHQGTCDVCGKTDPVTETRDFGYLDTSTHDEDPAVVRTRYRRDSDGKLFRRMESGIWREVEPRVNYDLLDAPASDQ